MLAEKYGAEGVQLVHGTFIPREYEWSAASDDTSFRSDVEAEPGYDELDMDLRDFDLVYAYPWPEEFLLFNDILRTCGREDCLFLNVWTRSLDRTAKRPRTCRRISSEWPTTPKSAAGNQWPSTRFKSKNSRPR